MMEYFGSRYAEYRPALPSRIINTLNRVSFERQVPSKGLSIPQISYALREFGFGTRIYSRDQYEEEFGKLISCYIESGIPVIVAVDNFDKKGKIGHAMIGVGHDKITEKHIDGLPEVKFTDTLANKRIIEALKRKSIRLYDYDDIRKKFVFIDDNCPAYTKATLDDPCSHYTDVEWKKCEVKYLITPLYKRIYLEAYEGKQFLLNFLLIGPYPLQDDQEILVRFFLTSGRSYKDKLSTNDSFSDDVKEKILATPLPKFIWVAELSNRGLIQQRWANGVVLLDATEANTDLNKPLVFGAYGGKIIEPDPVSGELKLKPIPLADFLIYESNLTSS